MIRYKCFTLSEVRLKGQSCLNSLNTNKRVLSAFVLYSSQQSKSDSLLRRHLKWISRYIFEMLVILVVLKHSQISLLLTLFDEL